MQNILKDINYNYNSKQITVIITLTGICNLHCKFCNQRSNKNYPQVISDQLLQNSISLLWNKLFKQFSTKKITKINFLFQGGQIFADIFQENIYNDLLNIKNKLNIYFKNIQYNIKFVSNGIFLKRDRVLNILNQLNATIIFSYDPIDRFLIKPQKKTFIDTLNYFFKQNKIDSFNILLNKKTINQYINDDSEIKRLCNLYHTKINLIYYTSNQNENIYNLTSQDIYNFYNFALNSNWQKICPQIFNLYKAIYNFKYNIKISEKHCNCQNTYRINPTNPFYLEYTNNCISCNYNSTDFKLDNYSNNPGENIIINGLIKNKCIDCKYNMNCIMPCWNTILNKNYTIQQTCPFKRIIQENLSNV